MYLAFNTGGLDLPSGASVFMSSTSNIKFEQSHFSIPIDIASCQSYTIPYSFLGRISDLPPPYKPGHCQSLKAEFHSRVELLGRPFEKSFLKQEIVVQYPMQLGSLCCPEIMKRGEVGLISIEVKNVSNLPYGNCDGSGGRVVLHLHFDSRIIPLGKVPADASAPYEVTHDPNLRDSTFIELAKVRPRDTLTVKIEILMESEAEFFDNCTWQVDLRLRDKLIEYDHQSIRVTPAYNPQKAPADILLVTSETTTHNEYVFWCHILDILGVSVDIWDTAIHCGFSFDRRTGMCHDDSWHGRYIGKMILYPHCDLKLLTGMDIVQHFHGDNFSSSMLQELGSSLIVFMSQSKQNEIAMLRHLAFINPKMELPERAYTGRHFSKPNPRKLPPPYAKTEKQIFKDLEVKYPNQASLLVARQTDITLFASLRYSYGSVDVRQLPILKSSKFLQIDGVGWLDSDNISPFPVNVPLDSKHGQAILAVIYGLSITTKLNLLKKRFERGSVLVFSHPNWTNMYIKELVMITLAREVADELFTCSGEALHMKEIYTDILNHTDIYLDCGRIVLRGLKLIAIEFKKRKSAGLKHLKVIQAYHKIADMSRSIEKRLLEAGVNNSKLEDMPSLEFLQDNNRVHHCHQHYAKEEVWNLVDN